jgi:hypothetical protein
VQSTKASVVHPARAHHANLALTASCADVARLIRFLTGAIMACGGEMLSRRFDPHGVAELEVEFSRIVCVEIYCILIAAGLELDRDAHLQLTVLCQCTRERSLETRDEPARLMLRVRECAIQPQCGPHASSDWPLTNSSQEVYEA